MPFARKMKNNYLELLVYTVRGGFGWGFIRGLRNIKGTGLFNLKQCVQNIKINI